LRNKISFILDVCGFQVQVLVVLVNIRTNERWIMKKMKDYLSHQKMCRVRKKFIGRNLVPEDNKSPDTGYTALGSFIAFYLIPVPRNHIENCIKYRYLCCIFPKILGAGTERFYKLVPCKVGRFCSNVNNPESFSSGQVIGNKWEAYLGLLQADYQEGDALDALGLKR
jgi:hypothetical protein